MTADLFDFADTRAMAEDGMNRAVAHADRVEEGWSERAYALLWGYAESHFEFMTEDVRVWAYRIGLPQPPDGRAWGAVTIRAVKARVIVRSGFRSTRIPPAHATPRPVWRSMIFREAA